MTAVVFCIGATEATERAARDENHGSVRYRSKTKGDGRAQRETV
jgi:hypothetical protein